MISNDVTAGNFYYCVNHWFPLQSKTFYNAVDSSDGYHQYSYLIDGTCVGEFRDSADGKLVDSVNLSAENNPLLDHTQYSKYETIKTDTGATLIFFSPINNDKPIKVELKKEGTYDITAADSRITIVCIIGPVTANDKELSTMQYATVFQDKTAKLVIPKNGVCALVSYA
jgi:hypothetical protein